MKTFLLLFLLAMGSAVADVLEVITPLVVMVTDPKGNPVPGAVVKVTPTVDDTVGAAELDKTSDFSHLAREAGKAASTNALGMALVYCGGRGLPAGKGIVTTATGTLLVTAAGFEDGHQPFKREFTSNPVDQTEMMLKITVALHRPPVADEAAAIGIAVPVWERGYGKEIIAAEKPYHATLKDGVWHVAGTLKTGKGGVAEADIRATDGAILKSTHGK